jgi:hypothetical protein
MEEQDNFDEVCKYCNGCPCDSGLVELGVRSVWILEHAEELRQIAKLNNWPNIAVAELEELIKEGAREKCYQELQRKFEKDVSAFFKQIAILKAYWANCKLFGQSNAFKNQFGNSHILMAQSMRESVVLQFTKLLTDSHKKVLTIEKLVEKVLEKEAPDATLKRKRFMEKIKEIQELPVVKKLVTEWRHNRLAHNNYKAALGVTKVSLIYIHEVDNAIEKLVAVFQELGRELGHSYDASVEHSTIPDYAEEIARIGYDLYAQSNPWIKKR